MSEQLVVVLVMQLIIAVLVGAVGLIVSRLFKAADTLAQRVAELGERVSVLEARSELAGSGAVGVGGVVRGRA